MRESYYHPDDLSSLDCMVTVDWASLFKALKQTPAADRMLELRGLKTHSQASRGKMAQLTFDWSGGTLDNKDQIEASMKQMVNGFYQMYWPMIGAFPISKIDKIHEFVPQVDGGVIMTILSSSTSVNLKADKDHLLTHFDFDSPAMKGGADLHYLPSPNPAPGDLRRISSMNITEQIGTSAMSVEVGLEYQTVGGFHIPQHVDFGISGAYSIGMDFTSCSVSQEVKVTSEPKE